MAIRTPTIIPVYGQTNLDGYQVVWSGMQNGDVGAGVGSTIAAVTPQGGATTVPAVSAPGGGFMSGFADKTIAAVGTFGTGGSVACEGSLDGGSNWFALTPPTSATPIALTAASLAAVTEAVIWVRPHVTAGDGTTLLTVTMYFRKTQQP